MAADEPKRGGLKLALIVLGILGGIAITGGGYVVWESKKNAEAEEKTRVEQAAQLQAEHDKQARDLALEQTQREAEARARARQESLDQALIEKEEAAASIAGAGRCQHPAPFDGNLPFGSEENPPEKRGNIQC